MKVILYTTYFSKLNQIPKTAIKLIITRFPPKWLNLNNFSNLFVEKSLSPSQEILLKYKKDNDWDSYLSSFTKEINTRPDLIDILNRLEGYLEEGNDVYLLCYEKDHYTCHRYLVGNYFKSKGFEVKEL